MGRYDIDEDEDDNDDYVDVDIEDSLFKRGGSLSFLDGLLIVGSITIGAIIIWFIIKWLEQNVRIPPPNYGLPQTPYWSPYPYSPYPPQQQPAPTPVVSTLTPACPPCVCGAAPPAPVMIPGPTTTGVPAGAMSSYSYVRGRTINSEKWDVHRDKRGAISSVEVHRDARED